LRMLFLIVSTLLITAASPNPETHPSNEASDARHHWRLAWWSDNSTACDMYIPHTGEPTPTDILSGCGEDLYLAWNNTPACTSSVKSGTQKCLGLYLVFIGNGDKPPANSADETQRITTSVSVQNCEEWGVCKEQPKILFRYENEASNPDDQYVLNVEIDGNDEECESSSCLIDMPFTEEEGVEIQYWAETPTGVTLYQRSFKMRNFLLNEEDDEEYRFDLIGRDWLEHTDTAANIWNIFPDDSALQSDWIEYAEKEEMLVTDNDYALLAGQLITGGYVNASECDGGGLLVNGNATECGEEKAQALVGEFQNRFNDLILEASLETRIPPKIIKGVIAQESQFWPFWSRKLEYGYGMITENGIDMLLNWNQDFYLELCNQYYTPDYCINGYSRLIEKDQQFLRGASLLSVGTDAEFNLLAETIKAAVIQTDHLVETITGSGAAELFYYDTLWHIALGVYTAGPGCMGDAISLTWNKSGGEMIKWEDIRNNIQSDCRGAKEYFDWVVYYGSTSQAESAN
jgi:hypothetical protein